MAIWQAEIRGAATNGKRVKGTSRVLDDETKTSTGFLLARIGVESRRLWTRMLGERELTPGHYGVLATLDRLGATSQGRLSKIVGVDPRNAVPIIDVLAARGLLERRSDPQDRRRHAVVLTRTGRALVRDLRRDGVELEGTMLKDLSDSERASLHRVLLKLFVRIAGVDEAK